MLESLKICVKFNEEDVKYKKLLILISTGSKFRLFFERQDLKTTNSLKTTFFIILIILNKHGNCLSKLKLLLRRFISSGMIIPTTVHYNIYIRALIVNWSNKIRLRPQCRVGILLQQRNLMFHCLGINNRFGILRNLKIVFQWQVIKFLFIFSCIVFTWVVKLTLQCWLLGTLLCSSMVLANRIS